MAKGAGNLFRLLTTMLAVNVPIDVIKDMLKGREINLADSAVDSLLSIVTFSRYSANKISRDGALHTLVFTFPFNLGGRATMDVIKFTKGDIYDASDIQSIRNIPIVGELFYRLLNA